jgi:flagellar hook assembly protein FlgD
LDRRVTLGAALFACLLAATLVTAVLVVRARTPDLVLEVTEPGRDDEASLAVGGPGPDEVEITFFVRESDPHALVGIVDSREDLVRTLDPDVDLEEREPVTYVWDGRTDDGDAVPPGRYRVLVELPSENREMIWPRRITVLE